MNISTANILEMLKDMINSNNAIKNEATYGFQFAYLHLTLTNAKNECQVYAHFDCMCVYILEIMKDKKAIAIKC